MSQAQDETPKKGRGWRRWALFGLPVAGVATAFTAGIIFWGGFNTAMEATNTMKFCISCHEMESTVYQEYQGTIHHTNRSGVGAVCSDCHVPKDWTHKIIRKVQASKEVWGKITGSISTPEKWDAKRLALAMNEWERMKGSDSRECRNCHDFAAMLPEKQKPRARQQHLNAIESGQTCIDCHKGIAHKDLRDRLDEDQLEALEAPNPKFARTIPPAYLESLARVEALEAEAASKAAEEAKLAADAAKAQLTAAVDAARADEQAKAAAAIAAATAAAADAAPAAATETAAAEPAAAEPAPAAAGGTVAATVDWAAIPSQTVTLFYPGQASFEWVQNGKEHGGARPFTKGGDRCSTCHAKELKDMGQKIVTGTKLEPTPIAGKRPAIDVALQTSHDDENLYLRLQWQNSPHTPVPFVEGGKMDPEHPVKVAMMVSGTGIDKVDQAGCWATCHNDNRYMPDAPDAAGLAAAGEAAGRLGATDGAMGGVTKYLAESRTEIELKGKDGKPLGGWDKLKAEAEIEALLAGGTFMDVLRAGPGLSENGAIMDHRQPDGGAPIVSEVTLDGDTWTAVIARPLKSATAGDITLEPGKTYTVGFAIHDDFTAARFHHVSLEFMMALDDPAAEINVVKP